MLLLTGATGFVGMEVLARFLDRTDKPVCALVRADDDEAAAERVRGIAAALYGDPGAHADRLLAARGDLERPGLGLPDGLLQDVTKIFHCAASVSFDLGLAESRAINVDGTRRMLDLASRAPRLERFTYVSTAYVAGTHSGVFRETDLDVGQGFRNSYERSKHEAETLVQGSGLPAQVLRPSIIVGDRRTGWTSAFNVLYAPLRMFARGAYAMVPARRSSPLDVVPVDYVADAAFELASHGEEGTFHLVAGRQATTVGGLMELAARYFRRRPPRAVPPGLYRRIVHPLLLRRARGRRRVVLERSEVYFPYLSTRVRYDDARARAALEPAGIRVSPLEEYFDRLVDFAVRSRWGRDRSVLRRAAPDVATAAPIPA
jgi:thioester reductase-like protein